MPSEGVSSAVSPVNLKDVDPPPFDGSHWKEAGVIKNLYIYPVKSMRGVSVQSAKVYSYKYCLIDKKHLYKYH